MVSIKTHTLSLSSCFLQHAEKFKKKHEKAQQKIRELEEELQRLTQTSHERETVLKDRLEEMRASLKPDTKPKGKYQALH